MRTSRNLKRASQSRIDFKSINRAALGVLPALVRQLLPGGRIVGTEYVVRNPTRRDRRPGSFKINVRTGKWADFATDDAGGDVISLVAYIRYSTQLEAARLLVRLVEYDD